LPADDDEQAFMIMTGWAGAAVPDWPAMVYG
jgi:hypothetical protein